ncbi:btk-binding protein-related [Anaeramoeba flamelloides]|uniref:Btk-binding protein-related n=1 Tax=Anaeramoeba flamelloides TaxID=1746091 RepID=A0ABQ8XZX4_9EUKA|nr:btk-binding protein-related [Anaeramoeba flamelloides]
MSIFVFGKNSNNKLGTTTKQTNCKNVEQMKAYKNQPKIKKIAFTEEYGLMLTSTNRLFLLGSKDNELVPVDFPYSKDTVKELYSNNRTLVIESVSNQIYIIDAGYSSLTLLNQKNLIRPIHYDSFAKQSIAIKQICLTENVIHFLTTKGECYFVGDNCSWYSSFQPQQQSFGSLLGMQLMKWNLKLKITRLYGGLKARHIFFADDQNQLYVVGPLNSNRLGVQKSNQQIPIKVPMFQVDQIQQCHSQNCSSTILYQGKVYSCGSHNFNGLGRNQTNNSVFQIIKGLEKIKIVKIYNGSSHCVAEDSENNFYIWGNNSNGQTGKGNVQHVLDPVKIELEELKNKKYTVSCGPYCTCIYPRIDSSMHTDFKRLYESEKYYDSEINGIKFINLIFKARTNPHSEKILQFLKEIKNTDKLIEFMQWVYFEDCSLIDIFKADIQDNIEISNIFLEFMQRNYQNDLSKLYKDEDSKDFNLLIKDFNEDEDEEEENEEDEDDDSFEEIPVHKWILFARSGLFREMFQNVKTESNSVKDFSGKSIESLEIFIKFLYTNKIELTADDDPQLVVEELEDALEYYQLHPECGIPSELIEIKEQFNLK